MRKKCIDLIAYFDDKLANEYKVKFRDEWQRAVIAGQSVVAYCELMSLLGNTDYNWQQMKENLYYKGTGVEW